VHATERSRKQSTPSSREHHWQATGGEINGNLETTDSCGQAAVGGGGLLLTTVPPLCYNVPLNTYASVDCPTRVAALVAETTPFTKAVSLPISTRFRRKHLPELLRISAHPNAQQCPATVAEPAPQTVVAQELGAISASDPSPIVAQYP
jgi:hypothetical protein